MATENPPKCLFPNTLLMLSTAEDTKSHTLSRVISIGCVILQYDSGEVEPPLQGEIDNLLRRSLSDLHSEQRVDFCYLQSYHVIPAWARKSKSGGRITLGVGT